MVNRMPMCRGPSIAALATLVAEPEAIEKGPRHLPLRMAGDMTQAASAGAPFFGVHHLRKDRPRSANRLPRSGA